MYALKCKRLQILLIKAHEKNDGRSKLRDFLIKYNIKVGVHLLCDFR